MHAVWNHLLDADFLEAYAHGIVVQCPDGVRRRFYPRILTYSADYPEKCVTSVRCCRSLNTKINNIVESFSQPSETLGRAPALDV